MIGRICKWFRVPPDIAERQDLRLCQDIMLMSDFAELAERDLHGDKLSEDEFKWLISMERAAGVLEIG